MPDHTQRPSDDFVWPHGTTTPDAYDIAAALADGADPESVARAVQTASADAGFPITEDDVAALANSFRLMRRLSPDQQA
jgi:hypothetical protein